MAYNTKKGKQQTGDVQFEGDPTDTQIDFENDFVAIKTNAQQRFMVSGSFIKAFAPLSCSVGISAGSLTGDSLIIGAGAGSTVLTVDKQLSNIASLDATTETTIENAIDTLAGLASYGTDGAETRVLGSLDVVQGIQINNANFVDASRNITGSGLLTNLAGITLEPNARIGIASDTDLLQLANGQLNVAGAISGSKGLFHVTNGTLQLGNEEVGSGVTFKVRSPSDNSIPLLIKTPGHDTILACTGSGQVVVGGLYLAAKLNITGSDTDKLISAKSDSADPAFYVSGSGDAYISGSLRAKQLYYTTHKFTPGSDALVYLRFDTVGIDTGPTNNNKMVAPHNGKLNKVVWRFQGTGTGGSTTTAFSLHKGVVNQQQIQATPVATVNLVDNFIDDTTYTATFLDTAVFASGDIVGVSIDPAFDPGITVVTCVWEFDQNN